MPVIGTDGSCISPIRLRIDDGAESDPPRIAVMFGISLLSLLAVSFPNISKKVSILRIPHLVFFIGKHFGTGVILSTAFGHLLPDAFESLNAKPVRERYPNVGKRTGMIILGSLLTIFLIEYISTTYVDHLHAKSSEPPTPETSPPPSRLEPRTPPPAAPRAMLTPPPIASSSKSPSLSPNPRPRPRLHTASPSPVSASAHTRLPTTTLPVRPISEASPLLPGNRHHTYGIHRGRKRTKSLCGEDEVLLPLILLNSPRLSKGGFQHAGLVWGRDIGCICPMGRLVLAHEGAFEHGGREQEREGDGKSSREREGEGGIEARPRVGRGRQVVGILVLQFGIMIHSLVIGLTLAVTNGTDFTSLVTAIMFHQLFEGLSLGIRMASLPPVEPPPDSGSDTPLSSSSSQMSCRDASPVPNSPSEPWSWSWSVDWLTPTLSILFAITTPLGIAIGMAAFAPTPSDSISDNQTAHMGLIQGVLSAISAGMLIYAATVEMLGGDFVFGDVAGDHGHSHDHGHGHGPGEDKGSATGTGTGTAGAMRKRVMAVASLLAGVLGMGLVGLGE